jgi:AraC-like DNA-binding protein
MKFETYLPCDALKTYVKHFIISENNDAKTYKVLPDTSLVMGFQYAGRLAYVQPQSDAPLTTAGITGLMDNYRLFKNTPHTGSVLVVFHETGAADFVQQPLHELFGESISLEHFFSKTDLSETEEKLAIANDDRQRINIIEQLLLKHLQPVQDVLISKAVTYIHQSHGTIRMTELARNLNTSQSPLEKRFRKIVGASPKKFSSIVRIKNVRSLLTQYNYQQAAYLAAYYDQAHFIKDFKTFTGETPEQYVKTLSGPLK